jgi:hypothetical protein
MCSGTKLFADESDVSITVPIWFPHPELLLSASGVSLRAGLQHQHTIHGGRMTDLAMGGFDVWNKAYPPPLHADNPQSLTPTSVFLFESLITHRSRISPSGWHWFDSTRHLAGYLLYVGIPDIAAWWFDESRFGDSGRMPLRDTVESATGADEDDRAFFYGIADDLEAVLAADDPIRFDAISRMLEGFTARFEKTPKWDFSLEAFPNAVVAGAALWERHEEVQDFTESEWLDLCARAGTDPAAGEVVIRVFEDAHTV